MKQYDYLVVGAGLYGAVFAQEAKQSVSVTSASINAIILFAILK